MTVASLLADLIRINSVNSFYEGGPGEAEIANFIEAYFHRAGLETWRQNVLPGRDNVVACLPGRDSTRRLVFEAHMDTVSIQGMTIPPFEPTVMDNRMYGRGSCDTKAGLAGMMFAIADLKRRNVQPPCEIWMAAVVDEEFSFRGALKLCEGLQAVGAVIAEPTGLRNVIASKGVLRWRMISRGVSAHSSKTHLGVNAISHMARVVLALEQENQRLAQVTHPLLGAASINVGKIVGGVQVNFVPDSCSIEIDRRLLPNETVEVVLEHYQLLLDRLRDDHPGFDVVMEQPMLVDIGLDTAADSAIAQVASSVLQSMGLDGTEAGVPFGSDASKLARVGVPSIIFGPGDIDQAHAAVEYVDLHQVEQAMQFYQRVMQSPWSD